MRRASRPEPRLLTQTSSAAAKGNRSTPSSPRGSIFSNFETVQLNTEERLYLHAARLGDALLLQDLLEDEDNTKLNPNCVDYMGRNALHIAVVSESLDAVETLLAHPKISYECIEEALLHAISIGSLNMVRTIVDHQSYLNGVKHVKVIGGRKDPFFRTEEKFQYPPDVTPLILAAHNNDHEMIQLFLSRGHTLDRPHAIHCQCQDCALKQRCDSLKRSRSRLNAYKALASSAYIALSSADPITTTFELRQEMMQVSEVEMEFKNEYVALVDQCMVFACEMMDLCRGTQEVEAVLGEESSGSRDPLARLRLAIQYIEKKFVSHPNCQQHLTSIWYGKEMSFMQTMHWMKKLGLIIMVLPALPFMCLSYIINPYTKVAAAMRCPVSQFVMHTVSHFIFLLLLTVATFGLEAGSAGSDTFDSDREFRSRFRPNLSSFTQVQYLIIFWIAGMLWIEIKQIYSSGAREHFLQYYNFMDFTILGLYIASYALRFAVKFRVGAADDHFNATRRADEAFKHSNMSLSKALWDEISKDAYGYFIPSNRFEWSSQDPEILADLLFAVANVLSFARTTYIMPSHELLGPLQISLGRMLGDIVRFIVLFLVVLFSFMVGMTNLYRYYGSHKISETEAASEAFKGLPETVHTLFFSIFGLIALDKLKVTPGNRSHSAAASNDTDRPFYGDDSTLMVDRCGMIMFALYQVIVTIVLVNMLIAMMSHSFEAIQGDNDMEWKFARTQLWMNYIDEGSTLPVPFNMLPTPKSIKYAWRFGRELTCGEDDEPIKYDFTKRRHNILPSDLDPISSGILLMQKTTYAEILQRLVRRYLFKLDREKYSTEKEKVEAVAITEGFVEEPDEPEEERKEPEQAPEQLLPSNQPASKNIPLIVFDEDGTVYSDLNTEMAPIIEDDSQREMIPAQNAVPPLRDEPVHTFRSSDAFRQLSRRATIRRSTKNSYKHPPQAAQLDAIQRGQKLLDARLRDMNSVSKAEELSIKDCVVHVRHLLTETQKAMGSLVGAMTSTQHDILNMQNVLASLYNRMVPEPVVVYRQRSDGGVHEASRSPPLGGTAAASSPSRPLSAPPGGATGPWAKDKKQRRWHSIKRSFTRKQRLPSDEKTSQV